jgi:hypothetical protein
MEDRNRKTAAYRGIERRAAATATTGLSTPVPTVVDKSSERHAAIRNKLPTLATYRIWSAKARTDWEEKEGS